MRQGPIATSSGASTFACERIEDIVVSWSSKADEPVVHSKGLGLRWITYKSICGRMGANATNLQSKDFNDKILNPYLIKLSNDWEQAFVRCIPEALDNFAAACAQRLETFHEQMMARPTLARATPTFLRTLEDQLQAHAAVIDDSIQSAKRTIQTEQRNAARLFYQEVKQQIVAMYAECFSIKGKREEYHHPIVA